MDPCCRLPGYREFWCIGFACNGKGIGRFRRGISKCSQRFWQYDPIADKWDKKADFPGKGRAFSGQFTIGKDGYAGFGSTTYSNSR
jgi:hypothetical protein